MRILQVITSLLTGGAETLVVNIVPRLRGLGHEVDVCVFDGEETPLMERLRKENPGVKIYRLGKGVYDLRYVARLAKIMRGYDIVHTHNSSPQLFVALAVLRCPGVRLVTTEHSTNNRKREHPAYAWLDRWMYRHYDKVVCISTIAEQVLRDYLGGKWKNPEATHKDPEKAIYNKVTTIPNGVDVEGIHETAPDATLLAGKTGRQAIVMVAGFREAKDQDTVVRAMTHLDPERFEVWLVGKGERMEAVQQIAKDCGVEESVRFLGLRTDVPQVLKAADIVVMSSHWEGLSLSNIEGMSAGKPFIASDVKGLREVTRGYGLLFPEGDDRALAAAIQRLHDEPETYKDVAMRCYERAKQFDIAKMVEGYDKVYREVSRQ